MLRGEIAEPIAFKEFCQESQERRIGAYSIGVLKNLIIRLNYINYQTQSQSFMHDFFNKYILSIEKLRHKTNFNV